MILWFAGHSQAGKTTLCQKLALSPNTVWIDADVIRQDWSELGYSKEDRIENCRRIANHAKTVESLGLCVLVSAIAPYRKLRKELEKEYGIVFLCVDHRGSKSRKDDERFELPTNYQTWTVKI